MLLGVVHLHSLGIVHRNITPQNILQQVVVPHKVVHVKLSGFGKAEIIPPSEAMQLFGRSRYFVKGGFSAKDGSVRSVRSGKLSVGAAQLSGPMRHSILDSQPEAIDEHSEMPPLHPLYSSADHGIQMQPQSAAVALQHNVSETQLQKSGTTSDSEIIQERKLESPDKKMRMPDSLHGEEHTEFESDIGQSHGAADTLFSQKSQNFSHKSEIEENSKMITRSHARENNYRYSTSVCYDDVPYKYYAKIVGGVSGDAFADYSFVAPEMFVDRYGPQADTWAVGCVAYSLLTGHRPFSSTDGPDSDDLIQKIALGTFPTKGKIWRGLTEEAKSIVSGNVIYLSLYFMKASSFLLLHRTISS